MSSERKLTNRGHRPQGKATDPLDNETMIQRFITLVIEHVPYSMFVDLDPPLTADRYLKLRNLAMIDRFYEKTDEEVCEKLGTTLVYLMDLRADPRFEVIASAIKEAASALAQNRSMDQWAEAVQDRVAQELFLVGVSTGSARDRVPALEAFADRTSAKKGRESDVPKGIFLPEDLVNVINFALQRQPIPLPAASAPDAIEISGTVLNVPAATPRTGGRPGE